MEKHFVTFFSPGSFVSETVQRPIDSWSVDVARSMIGDLFKTPNYQPYGFSFSTRGRSEDDLDSKVIDSSPVYYLGGDVETLEEVKARGGGRTLISNMERNDWPRIITNYNSWKITQPLQDGDIVLDYP